MRCFCFVLFSDRITNPTLSTYQRGEACTVRLLDAKTQKEFAQAPVVAGSVARVPTDSDRFVLRCVNKTTGQVASVGLSFSGSGGMNGGGSAADAQHAFHFANALKDFANFNKKQRERKLSAAVVAAGATSNLNPDNMQLADALEVSGRPASSLSNADVAKLPGLRNMCESTLMDPEATSVKIN